MKNATREDVREELYSKLVGEREKIKKLLSGPTLPRYKTILENKLRTIRDTLSDAHREQHSNNKSVFSK